MPQRLMHGDVAGLFMPCATEYPKSLSAQSPAGQAEPWWPGTPLHCPTSWLFRNSNACGLNEEAHPSPSLGHGLS